MKAARIYILFLLFTIMKFVSLEQTVAQYRTDYINYVRLRTLHYKMASCGDLMTQVIAKMTASEAD